ncbi:unnamed protein product [Chironomus riparius]|uniref:Secreted protein n=1 Tax=Chironomus riparius TaxID=315576 RepID=A0A9N9S4G6_9DIPT|nr:unnamed protein product [Chironomus riparius]
MKFLIAFIAFALISTAYSAGSTTKKPSTKAILDAQIRDAVGFINTFKGTVKDLKDSISFAINNPGPKETLIFTQNDINYFCSGVCAEMSTNLISCKDFTTLVNAQMTVAGRVKN